MNEQSKDSACPVLGLKGLLDGNIQVTLDGAFLRKNVPPFRNSQITIDISQTEIFDKLVKFQVGDSNSAFSDVKYGHVQDQLAELKELIDDHDHNTLKVIKIFCKQHGAASLSIEPIKSYLEEIIQEIRGGDETRKNILNQIIMATTKEKNLCYDISDYYEMKKFNDAKKEIASIVFEQAIVFCSKCPDRQTYASRYQCEKHEKKFRCKKLITKIKTDTQGLVTSDIKDILRYDNLSTYLREIVRQEFKIPNSEYAHDIYSLLNSTK